MSNTLMNLGVSGLNAALWGLTTTGQNISNAATPGYSVERPVYAEASGQYTSSGYLPQGVSTVTVERQYNQYLSNQLNAAQTQGSSLSTYYTLVAQLNNYVGSPTAGIATAITNYFTGLQTVANNAADPSARQTAMSNAQTLASQLVAAGQQYSQLRQSVNSQLTDTVTQINSYTSQIAQLNEQIASASSQGQPPNQLLDQRDLAVSKLSQLAGVQVVQSNGNYSVFLSGGQPLVVGNASYQLATVASPSDPSELTIVSKGVAGSAQPGPTQYLPDVSLTGGALGGLLAFRSQTLDPAQAQLGALAVSFASQVNAQNALGVDMSGNPGGSLFAVGAPAVYANQNNTGSATLSVSFVDGTQPTTSDYALSYDGAKYTLTDRATGSVVGTATPSSTPPTMTIGGLKLSLSSTPNAGDSFTVLPTRGALDGFSLAIANGSAIAAASPVLAAGVATNSGTGVISQGSVSAGYQLPSGTTTLAYNAASKTLSGFPVGTTVTIAGTPPTSINITSATTPVPYDPSKGASMTISSTTQPAPSGVMNGVSVSLSGTPADGDQFTIGANKGTNDGRNALALSQLVNSKTMNNGTTTLTGAYAGYVNAIGNAASQLKASSAAQTALVGQITQAQQSVSGVNQNEEAANLMQYQQLYQANAKVIQTANSVFQTVLGLFN
ncbi:flagellar hook-associated protein FlgK [Burkholderia pseudomallei]|uniref:Flagellar hook-associated protein 1 n=1 Tax=Burkholderia pseudomallei (strain 1710b) TaxID=320372 RepID=Q3JX15_BURP1|nr:flagellar hook-associated protein FlgK [Burkholderia pseudomallei]EIF52921.1 flagellar hook-associated protein FlgK [Burkholderia pseudomallei 1258a]ABA48595.1 flagellar hook-associated protein FlgK [Burkholderia pseudomallei 1710b]AIS47844.1 flagellar hook-associated protein FlgK [Burkholderia pseudomallei]AJX39195.1 flagellar hook-associated protein FlgK [Burkholderia pseudomallei]AJX80128.1 flagellar hook-associated protein FlgK [Burkholderia pseudomallei 7894]